MLGDPYTQLDMDFILSKVCKAERVCQTELGYGHLTNSFINTSNGGTIALLFQAESVFLCWYKMNGV